MPGFDIQRLHAFRDRTFHILPSLRLNNKDQAVDFVNERGFIAFWPIKGLLLPSLWVAAAGNRPVPDEHDDPGHKTWDWKDALLSQKRWYYGRVLAHRNSIISLEMAPFFYALSENYGDYHEDHLIKYEQGRMTSEAKGVYEALLNNGPLDTLSLRKTSHLSSRESNGRFNKALDDLQRDFKVLPIGIAEAGAWHYAFIYELTARHFPDLPERARPITERQARTKLVERYFQSVGAATTREVIRCFGWNEAVVKKVLEDLQAAGVISCGITNPDIKGEFSALVELVD